MSRRVSRTVAGTVVVLGLVAAPAVAEVDVTNTETVQVYLEADGEVDTARVYDQVDLTGSGEVDLSNPVTADSLRNLDGFGGFDVEDGAAQVDLDVDGEERIRTVSDYGDDLPVSLSVEYRLNGEVVEPDDIVGESGELEVRYTVKNETGDVREIEYDDGTGTIVTAEEEVFVPIVGSMTTTLPSTFTDVTSGEANLAGDGRGGTKLNFTLTLFPPIGEPEQEFGYQATITDGMIPSSNLSALPVSPLDSPTFATAAEGYQGGIESGIALAGGAQTIDENLLRLRDGASKLLGGLIQLRDGAQELSTGLAGRAAPGARELADGLGDRLAPGAERLADGGEELAKGVGGRLARGAEQLADGGEQLADGAGRLADGLDSAGDRAPALIGGLEQVSDGLGRVDAGLAQLYDGIGGLPEQAGPLHDGIVRLKAGIGSLEEEGTLLNGLEQIRSGLENEAVPALEQMAAGVYNSADTKEALGAYQKLGCAVTVLEDIVERRKSGFSTLCYEEMAAVLEVERKVPLAYLVDPVTHLVLKTLKDELAAGRGGLANPDDPMDRETLYGGLNSLKVAITSGEGMLAGLVRLQCGLSNQSSALCDSGEPGLLQGLFLVDDGVAELVSGVVGSVQGGVGQPDDTPDDETLRGGVNGLGDGVDQIIAGGDALIDGLMLMSDGAFQLHDGNSRLADGAGELADGAREAADGAERIADGAGQLADGAREAADGAEELADGLDDAAEGSKLLSEGLGEAAEGAPQLVDGAKRLSTEGTSKLKEAGQETAVDFGTRYALLEAGAQRAKNEPLVNGAPQGATLKTAFSYELPEVSGEGGRNLTRGVALLAVFALAAGAASVLRSRRS